MLSVASLSAQQVDDPGELQIITSHETEKDSGVWIDGGYIGYLRDFWGNKKIMLAPGEHELIVRKFGYVDFAQKIQIDPGQVQLLPISLQLDVNTQYPTENAVSLRINATPQEAAVLIDGAYVGYVRQIGRSLIVTAGRRKVRIEMQGYRPYETEVELVAGRAAQVRAVLAKGGPELDGAPRITHATISDGATRLELQPGRLYLYGMAVGSPGPSALFSLGQYATVSHAAGELAASIAYGTNQNNTYTTRTDRHIIGGAAIGGAWQSMRAFNGANAAPGASEASVAFTVEQNSFVVVLALASAQQQIALEGLPGLEMNTFHGGPNAAASMVIAHAELPPGRYTVVERSSGLAAGANRDLMSGLISVFVFDHR